MPVLITILIAVILVLGACRTRGHETLPPQPHDTVRSSPGSDTASHRPGL
jgi:hypothetical protein